MTRVTAALAATVLLSSCALHKNSSILPHAPITGGEGGPAPTVAISEIHVPVSPLYLAADDRYAYFGFGSSGTGSNLYRFDGASMSQTLPAPGRNGYISGGGVYGVRVAQNAQIYWLSAYFGNGAQPYVQVQCGAGAVASECEPQVEEPTSLLVDPRGIFWVGGLTFNGGGQIQTSAGQTFNSDTENVIALVNGPNAAVWGILRSPGAQSRDRIVEFSASGASVVVTRSVALTPGTNAGDVVLGSDGKLWFTDFGHGAIGTIDASGSVREFPAPHPIAQPSFGQSQMVEDCDGNIWFTEANADAVARITPAGAIDEFVFPTANAYPAAIAAPARHASACSRVIWIGEARALQLAKVLY